jgi:hypothetical protein
MGSQEPKSRPRSENSIASAISDEKVSVIHGYEIENQKPSTYSKLRNPLAGFSKEELFADVESFAQQKNLMFALEDLKKGALISQDPNNFEELNELSEEDKEKIRREKTHRWSQPFMLYFMTSTLYTLFQTLYGQS